MEIRLLLFLESLDERLTGGTLRLPDEKGHVCALGSSRNRRRRPGFWGR